MVILHTGRRDEVSESDLQRTSDFTRPTVVQVHPGRSCTHTPSTRGVSVLEDAGPLSFCCGTQRYFIRSAGPADNNAARRITYLSTASDYPSSRGHASRLRVLIASSRPHRVIPAPMAQPDMSYNQEDHPGTRSPWVLSILDDHPDSIAEGLATHRDVQESARDQATYTNLIRPLSKALDTAGPGDRGSCMPWVKSPFPMILYRRIPLKCWR